MEGVLVVYYFTCLRVVFRSIALKLVVWNPYFILLELVS